MYSPVERESGNNQVINKVIVVIIKYDGHYHNMFKDRPSVSKWNKDGVNTLKHFNVSNKGDLK